MKEGVYATYYSTEPNGDDFLPGYNFIINDSSGFYWSGLVCQNSTEAYRWEYKDGLLVLHNFNSSGRDDCNKPMEKSKPYSQYWRLIKQKGNTIEFQLYKEIYDNEEVKAWTDEIYIWKYIGKRF